MSNKRRIHISLASVRYRADGTSGQSACYTAENLIIT
jgi:hypothetical protein